MCVVSASHLPLFTKCTLSVALYWLSMLSLCLLVSIVLLLDRNDDNTRQHLSQLAYNYHRYWSGGSNIYDNIDVISLS